MRGVRVDAWWSLNYDALSMSRTKLVVVTGTLAALVASPGCDTTASAPDTTARSPDGVPAHADAPFRLRDPRSGLGAEVRLVGATPVAPAPSSATEVVYRAALDGRDVLVRTLPGGGFEDRVVVDRDDGGPTSVAYDLALDSRVAGLRLVDDVVELLDARGAPRLRMGAPVAHDHTGRVARLDVAILGCAFDTDPRAPFDRPLVSPGASRCTIRVSWARARLAPPAIIDPAWTPTTSLALARYRHVAERLPNGNVLVSGGFVVDPVTIEKETATTEIWSPTLGVWTQGAPMLTARAIATATPLWNGDVLVVGGLADVGATVLGTAEIYAPGTGTWSATGSLGTPRSGHTTTPVGDGTYLVAAGYDNSGLHFTNAELYVGGAFVPAGDINTTRFFHAAVTLPGNRVLVGGGTDPYSGAVPTLELYTAGVGWAPAAALAQMKEARTLVTAAVLPDGDAVFFGGYQTAAGELASAERYRPSTNTWTTVTGAMNRPRYDGIAVALDTGDIFVVGGQTRAKEYRDGELFDRATSTFTRFLGQSNARAFGHTATLLADGRVLAVGGVDYLTQMLASADVFDLALPTVDAGTDDEPDAGADASSPHDASVDRDSALPIDAATVAPVRDAGVTADAATSEPSRSIPRTSDAGYAAGGGCASAAAPPSSRDLVQVLALLGALALALIRASARTRS